MTTEGGLGVLAITHYARVLSELRADRVHVLMAGRIVASGGPELADKLEETGYEGLAAELGVETPVDEHVDVTGGSVRRPRFLTHGVSDPGGSRERKGAQLMTTGVPSGNVDRRSMASLTMRTQPCDTSWPMSPGLFVPWIAIWPSPPPNSVRTSEWPDRPSANTPYPRFGVLCRSTGSVM